jgi:hypothetical protein
MLTKPYDFSGHDEILVRRLLSVNLLGIENGYSCFGGVAGADCDGVPAFGAAGGGEA